MARMVACVKLGREAEGLDFPPYPGGTRQTHFRERVERSVETMA